MQQEKKKEPLSKEDQKKKRMEAELLAQKKRVEALQYLNKQGQSVDTVQAKALFPKQKSGDNTLDLLLRQTANGSGTSKALELKAQHAILKQQNEVKIKVKVGDKSDLAPGWTKILDEESKLYYYWNQSTDETTWEKPTSEKESIPSAKEAESRSLPSGWRSELHPATRQVFYVNTVTGERSGIHPSEKKQEPTSSTSSSSGSKRAEKEIILKDEKKRKISKDIDPLDPTGGKGKWSNGLNVGGKMADSTASGPLWQQRPYPAPGAILKNKPKADGIQINIGPFNPNSK